MGLFDFHVVQAPAVLERHEAADLNGDGSGVGGVEISFEAGSAGAHVLLIGMAGPSNQ
jgi:hypothetical protein